MKTIQLLDHAGRPVANVIDANDVTTQVDTNHGVDVFGYKTSSQMHKINIALIEHALATDNSTWFVRQIMNAAGITTMGGRLKILIEKGLLEKFGHERHPVYRLTERGMQLALVHANQQQK